MYTSWIDKDSYFHKMLECGCDYNGAVEIALKYLPANIFDEYKEKLFFIGTGAVDAWRVTPEIRTNREIIILSERILPKSGASVVDPEFRYFIFVVLHEVAHVVKDHQSPRSVTKEKQAEQEKEADDLAIEWFKQSVDSMGNRHQKSITIDEINKARTINQTRMERHSRV